MSSYLFLYFYFCISQVLQKDSHTKKQKISVCHPLELQSAFHRQTAFKSLLQLLRVVHPISKVQQFCTLLAAELRAN